MSRNASTAFRNALGEELVRPCIFYEGQFATGFVRLWSGLGEIAWNGQTWQGAGVLLGMGDVEESTDVVANGTSISLSGVPLDLVQLAIAEARQGLPGRVWVGLLTEDWQIIASPTLVFSGRLDVPQIADNGDSCTITISYENKLVDLTVPREWRYTHESQRALHPTDRGFEFVTSIQDKEITWGRG